LGFVVGLGDTQMDSFTNVWPPDEVLMGRAAELREDDGPELLTVDSGAGVRVGLQNESKAVKIETTQNKGLEVSVRAIEGASTQRVSQLGYTSLIIPAPDRADRDQFVIGREQLTGLEEEVL
jgi:hypothetical protein